jgi:hypothetical protein
LSFAKYGVPDAIDVGQDSSPAAGLQTRQIRDVGRPAQAWTPAPLAANIASGELLPDDAANDVIKFRHLRVDVKKALSWMAIRQTLDRRKG